MVLLRGQASEQPQQPHLRQQPTQHGPPPSTRVPAALHHHSQSRLCEQPHQVDPHQGPALASSSLTGTGTLVLQLSVQPVPPALHRLPLHRQQVPLGALAAGLAAARPAPPLPRSSSCWTITPGSRATWRPRTMLLSSELSAPTSEDAHNCTIPDWMNERRLHSTICDVCASAPAFVHFVSRHLHIVCPAGRRRPTTGRRC